MMNTAAADQNSLFSYPPFDGIIRPFHLNSFSHLEPHLKKINENPQKHSIWAFIGDEGSGKTCLSFHIANTKEVRSSRMVCSEGTKVINLAKFCFCQMGMQTSKDQNPSPFELLLSFIENLKENHKHFRLILDQADKLPLETIASIFHALNYHQEIHSNLTFVLIGSPALGDKIKQLTQADKDTSNLQIIQIPKLSFWQTRSYIDQSLKAASNKIYRQKPPLWLTWRIYQKSSGVPSNINHYTNEILMPRIESKINRPSTSFKYSWFLFGLIISIAFMYTYNNTKISNLFLSAQLSHQSPDVQAITTTPSNQEILSFNEIEASIKKLPNIQLTDHEKNDLLALNEHELSNDFDGITSPTIQNINKTQILDTSILPQDAPEPVETIFSKKIQQTLYTIQLISSDNQSKITSLFKQLQAIGYPVMLEDSTDGQQAIYKLTIGIFPSIQSASNIRKSLNLPEAIIQKIKPKTKG